MNNWSKRVAASLAAAAVGAIAVVSNNGGHLSHDFLNRNETPGLNQDTQIDQNEIDRIEAVAAKHSASQITINDRGNEKDIFIRQLDELFASCRSAYERSSPEQKSTLSNAMRSLFKSNPVANNHAFDTNPGGICEVKPRSPFTR